MEVITSLAFIGEQELEKEEENQQFRSYLKSFDSKELDDLVHPINNEVTKAIDCTSCGNCCQTLMINVTEDETIEASNHLQINTTAFKEKYVETSQEGQMIINTIR